MAIKKLAKSITLSLLFAAVVFQVFASLPAKAFAEDPAATPLNPTNSATINNGSSSAGAAVTTASDPLDGLVPCSLGGVLGVGNGTFANCLVQSMFVILYQPSQWIASIAGTFLDIFVKYSINSESYRQNNFVEKGWGIMRDITNIVFIFGLLVIAFNFVLGSNFGGNPKTLLVNILIFGLLINFSLFFARAITDAGNVLATVFYNNVSVTNDSGQEVVGETGEKNIALAVIGKSNPQRLFENLPARFGEPGKVALVIIAATAFNIGLIIVFFSMGYLFLGRVIGLMVQMIFAPLAFASPIFPIAGAFGKFNLKNWIITTLEISFMAPIFMFFLYLILLFQDAQNQLGYPTNGDAITTIISILLPYALTYVLLMFARKTTRELAGEVATMVSKGLTTATAVVGGAAVAAVALPVAAGGSAALGSAGARLAASQAGKTGIMSRGLASAGKKMATSSFDFRSSKLGGMVSQQLAKSQGSVGNMLGIQGAGKPIRQGGYIGMQEKFLAEQKKKAEEFSKIGDNETFARNIRTAQSKLDAANKMEGDKDAQGNDIFKTNKKIVADKDKEIESKQKEAAMVKQTGNESAIKAVGLELEQLKLERSQADQRMRATKKYKAIRDAKDEVEDAKDAYKDEEKRRKNAYADEIVREKGSYSPGVSNDSIEKAIREIKGEPLAEEGKLKKVEEMTLEQLEKIHKTQMDDLKARKAEFETEQRQRNQDKNTAAQQKKNEQGTYSGGSNNFEVKGFGGGTNSTSGSQNTTTGGQTQTQTTQGGRMDDEDNSDNDDDNGPSEPVTPPVTQ